MEHAEVLEQIEIAAVEPDGLDRLMAGDTPAAAAVAGHLAGCPDCVAELARIRRTATIAREVIHAQPDPGLRERTLAFVRAVGRDRGSAAAASAAIARPAAAASAAIAGPASASPGEDMVVSPRPSAVTPPAASFSRATGPSRWPWLAAAAAIVIVAAGIGYLAGGAAVTQRVADRDAEIALLRDAATTTMRIQQQPDARKVALTSTSPGAGASGSLVFSVGKGELVAVATGLPEPGDGQEYGCWVETAGQRVWLGRMYRAGDVWTWAGPVQGLDGLASDAVFDVSIGPAGGGGDGTPVLTGGL